MVEKMSAPAVMNPVTVSIIGGTGDGTVMGTVAVTPHDQPNLVLNVVSPLVALVVRFGNVFATTLLGLLTAAISPAGAKLLGAHDFGTLLFNCASLALAPACVDLLKNLVTIFGNLEHKYPLLTGSI